MKSKTIKNDKAICNIRNNLKIPIMMIIATTTDTHKNDHNNAHTTIVIVIKKDM